MFPFPLPRPPRRSASGFSLVEILVGMVIGMLGLIIMMQVFSLSEEQKRTTTGGGDAQSSAAIALFGLQRDIRQAGYGVSDVKLLGCSLQLRAGPPIVSLNPLAPLTINHAGVPAGDANTDTLLLAYSSTNSSPQGDGIASQPPSAGAALLPDIYRMATPTAFTSADLVIATPQNRATPCNLALTTVACVGDPCGAPLNTTNVAVTAGTGVANMSSGILFNLGRAPRVLAYAIRGGNLTQCDYMVNDCGLVANTGNAAIWVPIAGNIVSMRAQYGRDTSAIMDGIVDTYDQTTPTPPPPTVPTYECKWARISAVRLALVARSANFEKTAVTAAAPAWEGSAGNAIDLSANATWQNFRYKVIQTVVPIRNLVWQGVPTGC